jgi:hypothetical protein
MKENYNGASFVSGFRIGVSYQGIALAIPQLLRIGNLGWFLNAALAGALPRIYSLEAIIIQYVSMHKPEIGACQRSEVGRHTPAIPKTIPPSESNPTQRYIFIRSGS